MGLRMLSHVAEIGTPLQLSQLGIDKSLKSDILRSVHPIDWFYPIRRGRKPVIYQLRENCSFSRFMRRWRAHRRGRSLREATFLRVKGDAGRSLRREDVGDQTLRWAGNTKRYPIIAALELSPTVWKDQLLHIWRSPKELVFQSTSDREKILRGQSSTGFWLQ